MTPEEIIGMIGNISNRADIRAVQTQQVFHIKKLVSEERRKTMLELADFFENEYDGPSDQIRELVALMDRKQSGTSSP